MTKAALESGVFLCLSLADTGGTCDSPQALCGGMRCLYQVQTRKSKPAEGSGARPCCLNGVLPEPGPPVPEAKCVEPHLNCTGPANITAACADGVVDISELNCGPDTTGWAIVGGPSTGTAACPVGKDVSVTLEYKGALPPACQGRAFTASVTLPPRFQGVLNNVGLGDLAGFVVHYNNTYDVPLASADLRAAFAAADALGHAWIAYACGPVGSNTLRLFAAGDKAVVGQSTGLSSECHESNGAWWYLWDGKSAGFAESQLVVLNSGDISQQFRNTRISFHLNGAGGFRCGNVVGINTAGWGGSSFTRLVLSAP